MGGYVEVDVITDEERAIQMGEKPSEEAEEANLDEGIGTLEAAPPAQETEKPAEEAAAAETKIEPDALTEEERKDIEAQGFKFETDKKGRTYITDAEGTKIPEKRFGKIYREGKEAQALRQENEELKQKQGLFKQLGPDEYYRIFPDEKPTDYKPQEKPPAAAPTGRIDPLDLIVQDPDNPAYHGRTLREVKDIDPFYAAVLFTNWQNQQSTEAEKAKRGEEETRKAAEQEATSFGMARAKEFMSEAYPTVGDYEKLSDEQKVIIDKKVEDLGQKVIAWQTKNKCLHYSWEHAYKLMMHDDLIAKARDEGAKGTLKGLQKTGGPPSISTTGGGVKPSGWDAVAKMDEKSMDAHVDSMNDADLTKFLREAPANIRAKFPAYPWK